MHEKWPLPKKRADYCRSVTGRGHARGPPDVQQFLEVVECLTKHEAAPA